MFVYIYVYIVYGIPFSLCYMIDHVGPSGDFEGLWTDFDLLLRTSWFGPWVVGGDFNELYEQTNLCHMLEPLHGVKVPEVAGLDRTRWAGNKVIDFFLCSLGADVSCTTALEEKISDHKILVSEFQVREQPRPRRTLSRRKAWGKPPWLSCERWRRLLTELWHWGEDHAWPELTNLTAAHEAVCSDPQSLIDADWEQLQLKLSSLFSTACQVAIQNIESKDDVKKSELRDFMRSFNGFKHRTGDVNVKSASWPKLLRSLYMDRIKLQRRLGRSIELGWKLKNGQHHLARALWRKLWPDARFPGCSQETCDIVKKWEARYAEDVKRLQEQDTAHAIRQWRGRMRSSIRERGKWIQRGIRPQANPRSSQTNQAKLRPPRSMKALSSSISIGQICGLRFVGLLAIAVVLLTASLGLLKGANAALKRVASP